MQDFLTRLSLNIEPITINPCNPEDKIYRHSQLSLDLVTPQMHSFLEKLEVRVGMVEVFFTPRLLARITHIDTDKSGDIVKLNWIYCAGKNVMNWYKPKEKSNPIIEDTPVATKFVSYKNSEVELIHSEILTTNTVLAQVGVPHNITNFMHPRWSICFTIFHLKNDSRITMDEARCIFKDYII
jgi:hypothetical protein